MDVVEHRHAAQAEQVLAYLVALRGGAPFLSSADSRLLRRWLDARVPVPLILSALDRAAARRQQRRSRGRLSLNAVRKEIDKVLATADADPPVADARRGVDATRGAFARLAILRAQVASMPARPGHGSHISSLVDALGALGAQTDAAPDALATGAIGACRCFLEAAWDASEDDQERWLDDARVSLAPLEAAVGARVFAGLVEESARQQLRSSYPLLSAESVWDTLTAPMAAP